MVKGIVCSKMLQIYMCYLRLILCFRVTNVIWWIWLINKSYKGISHWLQSAEQPSFVIITWKCMNIMRRFTEMTCIVFLITCLTGISSVPFLINRHASWREPVNPYYVNTGYAMAPATSANDSEQQSMSSDADTLSLTDSSVYVHIDRRTNTHTRMDPSSPPQAGGTFHPRA